MDVFGGNVGVGKNGSFKSFLLRFSGIDDFGSDGFRTFCWDGVQDLVDVFSRDFQDHIDPIKKWSGYFVLVSFDILDRAHAWFFAVFEVAAFAGIHGCYKHDVGWIFDGAADSRDDDGFVFERLSEDFERLSRKFCEFVEKKNSFVGEGNFAWREACSSADDRNFGSGMMNLTKRSGRDERLVFVEFADHGIDLADFENFFEAKRGQDALQRFTEEGFA